MAEEGPNNKAEIQEIFRRLRLAPANRSCFDCGAKNPTWSSVTYGVFICIDCSAVHRSLGVHLSFVRSTQLDTNWTWSQLRCMQLGGNANAHSFFSQHHCTSSDSQQKYNSRAAQLYREKLNQLVAKHNKLHGYKIVFESDETVEPTTEKDFFEHVQESIQDLAIDSQACLVDLKNKNGANKAEQMPGPSVEGVGGSSLSSPSGPSAVRKSTIGAKRPTNKGLGAKKIGLGAQKVKADFSVIQKEAEMLDEMKEQQEAQAKVDASKRVEDEERQMATMSLTYQEISKQQKKRMEIVKNADPKKAEQAERLGMGVGVRSGVSHSVLSEMQVIEQETPISSSRKAEKKHDSFFDDYEIVETSNERGSSLLSGFDSYSKSSTDWDFDRPSKPKTDDDEFLAALNSAPRPKTREPSSSSSTPSFGTEAQKKFGNAKAISSDQMFGDSRDNDYERRSNLSRFEGKSSISSSEYFGTGDPRGAGATDSGTTLQALQSVDLDDVKESFRQGVTKVAGRLGTLANGMMSSFQEKYGY
ncbi:ADP-ribosylation factor GTPase-activating protein 2 [Orchesella cincta]|uniref:ADP-ribosylation factor GTPase-activating protein 2 n=1 Tax=Orchesella cincta TaxID=48709 RepID=A0A1D2NNI9_ORCCI|nr:ADP-ribosylation factor GTPase-activating protein 2 [Orchesella cincta]